MPRLPSLDLFSGVGGNVLALKAALKPVAYCEIDPVAAKILAANMARGKLDRAPVFPDVTTLKAVDVPGPLPQVICASFPCQDISVAGNGAGIDGERSGLVSHVFRLVDEFQRHRGHRVPALYFENSPIIVSRGLDTLVADLEKRGFRCTWCILSAWDVGARQIRKRWFMVARRPLLKKAPGKGAPGKGEGDDVPLGLASYKFDFNSIEAVPRIVRGSWGPERKAARARFGALGNAVVPPVVVAAWNHLARLPGTARGRSEVHPLPKHDRREMTYVYRTPGGAVLKRAFWPTPVHSTSHFDPTVGMEGRVFKMLGTRVFHERGTKREFRYTSVAAARRVYMMNPEFVEALMGFPRGWTSTSASESGR